MDGKVTPAPPLAQSGPRLIELPRGFHGECCDDCGWQVASDGTCPNCELKYEQEQRLKELYQI